MWGRVALAAVFGSILFYVRWKMSISFDDGVQIDWNSDFQPFDFQIWRASDVLADQGLDPYDEQALFREIGVNYQDYGGSHWIGRADSCVNENRSCMYLFNPPTWLAQIKLFGPSAMAMNIIGMLGTYGSLLWLSRKSSNINYVAFLVAATYFFSTTPGISTFRFGQVGFLIAGLVGLRFVLYGKNFVGLPIAMLSFKPHISLASGISELWRQPLKTALRVGVPLGTLLFVTLVLFPFSYWSSWLEQLDIQVNPLDDMTFSTISATNKLPDSTDLYFLLAAFVVVVVASWLLRHADPYALALWSLAMITFFSGHGYSHDWLWLVFVPVLRKWSWLTTLSVATVFCIFHKIGWESSQRPETKQTVSMLSLVALAAVVYLGVSVVLSHFQNKENLKNEGAVDLNPANM